MNSALGASIEAELRHKRITLQIQKTLAEGKVSLPLEQPARENGLSEFEKLILALAFTPNVNTAIEQHVMHLSQIPRSFRNGPPLCKLFLGRCATSVAPAADQPRFPAAEPAAISARRT